MDMKSKLLAEFLGTLWIVLGGCGAATLASTLNATGSIDIGLIGVSLAFGLTVMTMAYAVGHISGGHFNPAISVGMAVGGHLPWSHVAPYAAAQVGGAIAASAILLAMISGNGAEVGNLASNGYAQASPGGYNLMSVLLVEVIMTAALLFIIMMVSGKRSIKGTAPLIIGISITVIHLVSIPVSNTSVNPARSTGPALLSMDPTAISQLWLFWLAPIVGAVLGVMLYKATSFGSTASKDSASESADINKSFSNNIRQMSKLEPEWLVSSNSRQV